MMVSVIVRDPMPSKPSAPLPAEDDGADVARVVAVAAHSFQDRRVQGIGGMVVIDAHDARALQEPLGMLRQAEDGGAPLGVS